MAFDVRSQRPEPSGIVRSRPAIGVPSVPLLDRSWTELFGPLLSYVAAGVRGSVGVVTPLMRRATQTVAAAGVQPVLIPAAVVVRVWGTVPSHTAILRA